VATCSTKDLAKVAAGPSPGVVLVACMDISADPASNPYRGISCCDITGVAKARKKKKNHCKYSCIHNLIGRLMFKKQYSF